MKNIYSMRLICSLTLLALMGCKSRNFNAESTAASNTPSPFAASDIKEIKITGELVTDKNTPIDLVEIHLRTEFELQEGPGCWETFHREEKKTATCSKGNCNTFEVSVRYEETQGLCHYAGKPNVVLTARSPDGKYFFLSVESQKIPSFSNPKEEGFVFVNFDKLILGREGVPFSIASVSYDAQKTHLTMRTAP